jgi:hypothetical protein
MRSGSKSEIQGEWRRFEVIGRVNFLHITYKIYEKLWFFKGLIIWFAKFITLG